MPLEADCPACKEHYVLHDSLQGKRVRCRSCGDTFTVASPQHRPEILDALPVEEDSPRAPDSSRRAGRSGREQTSPGRARYGGEEVPGRDGKRRARRSAGPSRKVLILAGAGLLLLLAGGVAALVYSLGGDDADVPTAVVEAGKGRAFGPVDPQAVPSWNIPKPLDPTAPVLTLDDALAVLRQENGPRLMGALLWLRNAPQNHQERPRVARALEGLLHSRDVLVRRDALQTLARWATPESVPALLEHLDRTRDRPEVIAVAAALVQTRDPRALAALGRMLDDPATRSIASDALASWGPEGATELLKRAGHPNPLVRQEVTRAPGRNGGPKPTDVDALLADLRSPDPELQRAAAEALAVAKPEDSQRVAVVRGLAELLASGNPLARDPAMRALEKWFGAECVPDVVAILPRQTLLRRRLFELLVTSGGEEGLQAVATQVDTRDASLALLALAKAGPKAEKAVAQALLTATSNSARVMACRVLGNIGTRDSLPALGRAASDPLLRGPAQQAIQAIQSRP